MEKIMNKRLWLYLIVCFGFSWTIAAGVWLMGGLQVKGAALLLFPYMWGPGIAGLICVWRFHKGERAKVLGFTGGWNLWLLWAWLIGAGIVVAATLISLLAPESGLRPPVDAHRDIIAGMDLDPAQKGMVEMQLGLPFINVLLIAQAALLGPLINTPLMLSEELGWRGWLWHNLRPNGFWTATFWIGLLWGVWHIPIILLGHNYPGMPVAGAALFILFCVMYAPIYSYVREKSGAIWAACVLHGTGNAMAGTGIIVLTNPEMPWRGVLGIGGFVAIFAVTLWVYFKVKGNGVVTANP